MFALLYCLGFVSKTVNLNENVHTVNIVFRSYDSNVHLITVTEPLNSAPTFIFEDAKLPIEHLSIVGNYGIATETGLIWSCLNLSIFNLTVQMYIQDVQVFYLARYSLDIMV